MLMSLIQLFLVVMLVFSAVMKWASYRLFTETIKELGFSNVISTIGITTLPLIELLIAASLSWEETFLLGNILFLILLIFFLTISIRASSNKKRIKCNCFGSFSEERFGWVTYTRITCLAMLSLILFLRQETTQLWDISIRDISYGVSFSVGILMIYSLSISIYRLRMEVNDVV